MTGIINWAQILEFKEAAVYNPFPAVVNDDARELSPENISL
jgi:hypothetical protein